MDCNSAKVFKVETFGAVDGPGIRLVIFLQGCTFRCKYCHNPESWTGSCSTTKDMTVDQIIELFERNKSFYSIGGITLSGGEPMIQADFVLALAKKCKAKNIHLAIDTSACTITNHLEHYQSLLDYVDLWIVDIKALDEKDHEYITGDKHLTGLKLIQLLEENNKPYWVRQVIVKDINDNNQQLDSLASTLANLKLMTKYELIPYHNMAISKYNELHIDYPLLNTPVMNKIEFNKIVQYVTQAIDKYKKV